MTTVDQILTTLKQKNSEEINEYDEGFLLPPATEESLAQVTRFSHKYLYQALSDDYLQCLKLSDGFSLNGLNLYSSAEKLDPYFLPVLSRLTWPFGRKRPTASTSITAMKANTG